MLRDVRNIRALLFRLSRPAAQDAFCSPQSAHVRLSPLHTLSRAGVLLDDVH